VATKVCILFIGALLAACQTQIPPTAFVREVAGTPISQLSIASQIDTVFQPTPTILPDTIIDAADAEYRVLTNIYARVSPSVVNIDAVSAGGQGQQETSSGSGFVLDHFGHILTSAHLIQGAQSVSVTFQDGFVANAAVIGEDVFSDLAVLRVLAPDARLTPVAFGSSDHLHVGERAIAIGSPFGLSSTMTVGIISGLGRQLPSAALMGDAASDFRNPAIIQFDATINPGNSGGPLLNSRGEVIGVTTAITTDSGIFQGVGFAVPVSTVQRVVPDLIADGMVDYAWLGVSSGVTTDGFGVNGLADPLNLPVRRGVLVAGVAAASPADLAGLRGGTREVIVRGRRICAGGDIIVAIDGAAVNSMDDLLYHLMLYTRADDDVILSVVRGDAAFDVPVRLRARPPEVATIPACGNAG
jgi:2-alkenal reductase